MDVRALGARAGAAAAAAAATASGGAGEHAATTAAATASGGAEHLGAAQPARRRDPSSPGAEQPTLPPLPARASSGGFQLTLKGALFRHVVCEKLR